MLDNGVKPLGEPGHTLIAPIDTRHHAGSLAPVEPTLVPFVALAIMETLSGIRTGVADPFLDNVKRRRGQALFAHQSEAIDRAAENLGIVPAFA